MASIVVTHRDNIAAIVVGLGCHIASIVVIHMGNIATIVLIHMDNIATLLVTSRGLLTSIMVTHSCNRNLMCKVNFVFQFTKSSFHIRIVRTRQLRGLGCALGVSVPTPPLGLHACSIPPAKGRCLSTIVMCRSPPISLHNNSSCNAGTARCSH